jgi:hypothetical protein
MQKDYSVEIERRLLRQGTVMAGRTGTLEQGVLISDTQVNTLEVSARNLQEASTIAKRMLASKKGWRGTFGDAIFYINIGEKKEGARVYNLFEDGVWYTISSRRQAVHLN